MHYLLLSIFFQLAITFTVNPAIARSL